MIMALFIKSHRMTGKQGRETNSAYILNAIADKAQVALIILTIAAADFGSLAWLGEIVQWNGTIVKASQCYFMFRG